MFLPALALLMGIAVGLATGGRFRALGELRFRHTVVLVAALAIQLTLGSVPGAARVPLMLVSYAAVGTWMVSNCRARPRPIVVALGLLAAGWALNLAVMAPNGGMPVSRHALDLAGAPASFDVESGNLYKHVPARRDTVLRPLGDVLPVPPLRAAISVGDVLLFVGTAAAVALAMRGRAAQVTTASAAAAR